VFPPPEDGKAAGGSSTGGGGSGAGGKSKVDAERQQEEEDELQLALALSISENEAKKKTTPAPTATKQMTSSTATPTVVAVSSSSSSSTRSASPRTDAPKIVRVRAEFDFIAQEPSELTFRKGDVIEVTDRSHQDWWRGRLGAATGAFPANYVVRKQHCCVLSHAAIDPLACFTEGNARRQLARDERSFKPCSETKRSAWHR